MDTPPHHHAMPFTRLELCVLAAVDGALCVLLARRAEAPMKGRWALPGGVLRIDLDRDLEAAAQRVATERLGVALPYVRQQCAVGGRQRDPRSPWALSVVYTALVHAEAVRFEPGKRIESLRWAPVEEAMEDATLAFDHAALVRSAVEDLRADVADLELPFEWLPPQFTLGELQATCELLLGRRLDKSSFRRRLDDRGLVEPVAGEFRKGANRPAQVFRLRPRTD